MKRKEQTLANVRVSLAPFLELQRCSTSLKALWFSMELSSFEDATPRQNIVTRASLNLAPIFTSQRTRFYSWIPWLLHLKHCIEMELQCKLSVPVRVDKRRVSSGMLTITNHESSQASSSPLDASSTVRSSLIAFPLVFRQISHDLLLTLQLSTYTKLTFHSYSCKF